MFSVGNKISEHDINKSIKSLFKTGRFEDIKVIYSGDTIIFNVEEKPVISSIIITGNNIVNSSILEKYLTKLKLIKGYPFNILSTNIFTKTLEEFYHDLGRYKSNIKILQFFSKNNTINLKILIDEGIVTKINRIKILGVKKFSEKKILSLFQLTDRKHWWNITDKRIYSPKELHYDLEKLNNFYLNQGYFYFNIDTKKVEFLRDENKVNIRINVFEGNQYKISNVVINGHLFPYKNLIKNIIKIKKNELYNKEKINNIVDDIKIFLSEMGYINAKIIVNPKINNDTKTIALNFDIDIKNRFFVKKIYFSGNELTQDKVLRREIKQKEGEYFDIKLVELGKKLLEKTKFFSDVQVITQIDSNKSDQVDITYKVKEQSTGSINFGLGYGKDSGIGFNVSFSQDNIFGYGNSFKASAIKNENQKYADLSIIYPYFIANNTDLNTRFFYNDFKYNFNSISNIIKNTYGFENNLSFLINENNKFNFGFGYTHNGINNTEKNIKNLASVEQSSDITFLKNSLVNDFTINYSWIYDSLKYFYFPVSGNQTYISGKNTIPGSDNNFYKITLDSEQYMPFNEEKEFIFFSHVHMGIGHSFNEEQLPFYENFYASSVNNIRGFLPKTIGPKTIYDNKDLKNCIGHQNNNVCESIDSIGGNATFVTNFELITPIPFIEKKYSQFLRTSLFLDAGNIWNTESNTLKNINTSKDSENNFLNNIYSSVGISLQWFSPIGPLVFSYSLPIHTNNNYQLEPFQFNIGKNW